MLSEGEEEHSLHWQYRSLWILNRQVLTLFANIGLTSPTLVCWWRLPGASSAKTAPRQSTSRRNSVRNTSPQRTWSWLYPRSTSHKYPREKPHFEAAMSKVVRSVKNVTKGYSHVQVKVRNGSTPQIHRTKAIDWQRETATSNDPWGPTGTEMSEIAQMTFNGYAT